jgi:hypothetical protein
MKKRLLLAITLCLSIMGCTKRTQITPTSSTQENVNPVGLKGQNHILPGVDKYRLLVKFKAEQILDVEKSKPVFSNQRAAATAESWGKSKKGIYSFTYEQVIPFEPQEKAAMKLGRMLRKR